MKPILDSPYHSIPDYLNSFISKNELINAWNNLTELSRNEWICYIIQAKKAETKQKRMNKMHDFISTGKHRPCCFEGCPHRDKNTIQK